MSRDAPISVRVPPEVLEAVEKRAEGLGLKRNSAIVAALEAWAGLEPSEEPRRPGPVPGSTRPKLDTSSIGLPAGATLKPASSLLDQEKDNGFIRQMGLQSKAGKKR